MHDNILLEPKPVKGISRESQKTSVLPSQDARTGHVFGAIADACPNKQMVPQMRGSKAKSKSVRFTRANVPQNSLVLDSGATVHLISNPEMMQKLHHKSNSTTIHCGGKSWNHTKAGELCDDLKELPFVVRRISVHHMNPTLYI